MEGFLILPSSRPVPDVYIYLNAWDRWDSTEGSLALKAHGSGCLLLQSLLDQGEVW